MVWGVPWWWWLPIKMLAAQPRVGFDSFGLELGFGLGLGLVNFN